MAPEHGNGTRRDWDIVKAIIPLLLALLLGSYGYTYTVDRNVRGDIGQQLQRIEEKLDRLVQESLRGR